MGKESFKIGHYFHSKLPLNISSEGHSTHRVSGTSYWVFKNMVVTQNNHISHRYDFYIVLYCVSWDIVLGWNYLCPT